MKKSGGIIAMISGIFGTLAAIITIMVGGIGKAFSANSADTVFYLGIGGVFFAFLTIILGAVAMNSASRVPGALLIIAALAGAFLGGTLVAVCMVLALVGGVLAVSGSGSAASAGARD